MTEIERLQAENSRLQRQLGVAGLAPLPPCDMPDPAELVQLHSIVVHRYPQLACSQNEFEKALLFMAWTQRREKLNAAFFPLFWLDGAKNWLRRQGYPTNLSLEALVAAAVASGVPFSPLDNFPRDCELGLQVGTVSRPSNAWRKTIANGLSAPTPLNRPRQYNEQHIDMIQSSDDDDGPRHSDVRVSRL